MAKDIFLGPSASPAKPLPTFKTPPAAKPLPGMQGQMPLPTGRMLNASQLTESELADLRQIPGWKEGDPIPVELADVMTNIRNETKLQNLQPPVPMDTPVVEMPEPVEMSKLPADKRAVIEDFLREAQANAQGIVDFDAGIAGAGPGVNDAISGRNVLQLDDDREPPAPEPPAARRDDLGLGGLTITHCPHCNWQLDVADIEDPTPGDKQAYLQSILGLKPFEKNVKLFGGHVDLTLRELHPREVDAVFLAASQKVTANDTTDAMRAHTFMEWVDRYRLSLQISRITIGEQPYRLPSSLEEWQAGDKTPAEAMADAEQIVFGKIATTESLGRSLMSELARFCRLVAKLEVRADDPNFWQAVATT